MSWKEETFWPIKSSGGGPARGGVVGEVGNVIFHYRRYMNHHLLGKTKDSNAGVSIPAAELTEEMFSSLMRSAFSWALANFLRRLFSSFSAAF